MILSHSRHLYARAVLRMDQQAWIESHVAAFTFFKGVPRRIVPDNLKSGVLRPISTTPASTAAMRTWPTTTASWSTPRARKPTDKPRIERQIPFLRRFLAGAQLLQPGGDQRGLRGVVPRGPASGSTARRGSSRSPCSASLSSPPCCRCQTSPTSWPPGPRPRSPMTAMSRCWAPGTRSTIATGVAPWWSRSPPGWCCYLNYELIKTHLRIPKGQRSTDWDDYPPEQSAFFRRTPTGVDARLGCWGSRWARRWSRCWRSTRFTTCGKRRA